MFGVNPLKGIQKRLSAVLTNTLFSGPAPIKLLRKALEEGDEEKAIEIYTCSETNPKTGGREPSLMEEINPSDPFPSKKAGQGNIFQTPLHIAAEMGLYKILLMFLDHGGNPNSPNGKDETCLHSVCSKSDKPLVRLEILNELLKWKGPEINGSREVLSVNHADADGNIALHYAASNGLLGCVQRLVELNSILSLVNKSQNTCCEMADENGYRGMASMLELAILFQPNESEEIYATNEQQSSLGRNGMLFLDSTSMDIPNLHSYTESIIDQVYAKIAAANDGKAPNSSGFMTRERVEVMLNAYSWDFNKLLAEFSANPAQVFTVSKIEQYIEPTNTSVASDGEMYCGICSDTMSIPLTSDDLVDARENPEHLFSSRRSLACPSGHQYCLDCWKSHIQVQVRDNGGYCMSCPGYKCHEIVAGGNAWAEVLFFDENEKRSPIKSKNSDRKIEDLLKSESTSLTRKYYEQRARHVADCCSGTMKWCPVADCGAVIRVIANDFLPVGPDGSLLSPDNKSTSKSALSSPNKSVTNEVVYGLPTSLMCHNGHTFCMSCGLDSHTPCSCDDWNSWQNKVQKEVKNATATTGNSDDIENALWLAANTKKCPRCASRIEKDEGCNHMSCRKCRHEFCWICMQDWSQHSNATGGFFQCNRFVAEQAQNGGGAKNDEDEEPLDYGSGGQEGLGNAHLEALRSKERGNKMARFIPLYTRLKAHSDSAALEKRMYPESMTRIIKSIETSDPRKNPSNKTSGKYDNVNTACLWLQKSRVQHPLEMENFPEWQSKDNGSINPTARNTYPPALLPLQQGFEELIKCRQFLIGCVAYSFNTFETSIDEDNPHSFMRALTRNRSKYQASLRLESHKQSYERILGDLEMYTEMLSDVVARRRLRASNSQISAIMSLARTKRLELEELIFMFRVSESYANESNYNTATKEHRSNHRSGRRSSRNEEFSTSAAAQADIMSRFSIGPDGLLFLDSSNGEDEEDMDINSLTTLIHEMERYQLEQQRHQGPLHQEEQRFREPSQPVTPNSSRSNYSSQLGLNVNGLDDIEFLRVLQTSEHFPESPRLTSELSSTAAPRTDPSTNRVMDWLQGSTSSNPRVSRDRDEHINLANIDFDILTPTPSRSTASSHSTVYPPRDPPPVHIRSPDPVISESSSTLSRRAEEEAALNRAILLSLGDIPVAMTSRSRASTHTAAPIPTNVSIVDENHVSMLMSMGFNREQSINALSRHNNDIDEALNSLLSG